MKINTKVTNTTLTPAISSYLEKKLSALNKIIDPNDESAMANIEIGKTTNHHRSGDVFKAEINLHLSGKDFYAVAEEEDLYAAIDAMKDEIVREVRSWKGKQQSLLKRGGLKVKNILKGFWNGDNE